MSKQYEAVIGLEIHAVMETNSKMFCSCPVVDSTHAIPNDAVCPVCAGMPGMLPVLNKAAVEYALRVALALNCEIQPNSLFERKSYFYPDLPKGFQISQYEQPLATTGYLEFESGGDEKRISIRRVHLEEDTGKLTHREEQGRRFSLVDLNRSGIPLLEIVTEPELHSPEEVRDFAYALRSVLRYVEVNSGNLEKGLLRLEPNISIRPMGSQELNTRVEIKNLNSFRSVERSVAYELERQETDVLAGKEIRQVTLGWDDVGGKTLPQRSKEFAEDYRYFPEPDLPPLQVDAEWVEQIRAALPELPGPKRKRFAAEYGLNSYDAALLVAEKEIAEFFEDTLEMVEAKEAKAVANWISGPLFSKLNDSGLTLSASGINAPRFAELMDLLSHEKINPPAARRILDEMFSSDEPPSTLMQTLKLEQVSSGAEITEKIAALLENNPDQLANYLGGKEELFNWFFGQIMAAFKGKANPKVVRESLKVEIAKEKLEMSMPDNPAGMIEGLYIKPAIQGAKSDECKVISVEWGGFEGDKHFGLTMKTGSSQKPYAKGSEVRNTRQISIVSVEEMAQIASGLSVPALEAQWLGANMLISGVEEFTKLPPGSRIHFEGGVGLVVEGSNSPCTTAGGEVQENFPEIEGLTSASPKQAIGRRGIVAWVEKPGKLSAGESFEIRLPKP